MATQFSSKYFERSESYTAAMVEMFKTIPLNDGIPMTSREKSKINYRYWRWMVFGKMSKGTATVEENKTW